LYRNTEYNIVPRLGTNEGVWSLCVAKEYNVVGEKYKKNVGT
jgi:hypothetical protein